MQDKMIAPLSLEQQKTRLLLDLAITDPIDERLKDYRDSDSSILRGIAMIKKMPQEHIKAVVNTSLNHRYPLNTALILGQFKIADYLLDLPETDVNLTSESQPPALLALLFCSKGGAELVPLFNKILGKGANLHIVYQLGGQECTLLSEAVRMDVIRGSRMIFIDQLLELEPTQNSLSLALTQSIICKSIEIVKKLIEAGAELTDEHIKSAKHSFFGYKHRQEEQEYFKGLRPEAFEEKPAEVLPPKPLESKDVNDNNAGKIKDLSIEKKQLLALVKTLLEKRIVDPNKRNILQDFYSRVEAANFPPDGVELKKAAKNVIMLALQRTRFDFFNTTNSGLRIRSMLNEATFSDLKCFLFPPDPNNTKLPPEPVTYRGLRTLIVGENRPEVFSHKNKGEVFLLFQQARLNPPFIDEATMRDTLMTKSAG